MKVLISGVTGRVGANLAHQLMERGNHVRGLVMPSDPKADKAVSLGVEIVEADIADADRVRAAADGVDIVIHQAAQILEGIYPSERMLEINTQVHDQFAGGRVGIGYAGQTIHSCQH